MRLGGLPGGTDSAAFQLLRVQQLPSAFNVLRTHEQANPTHPKMRSNAASVIRRDDRFDFGGFQRTLGKFCVNAIQKGADLDEF